jgi:hypothetical protein
VAGAQREYGGAMSRTHLMWARGGVRSMGICRGQDRHEPIHGGFGKNIHVFDDPGRDRSPSTRHPRVTTSDERHASPRCPLRVVPRTAWEPALTLHVAVRAAPKIPASVSARRADAGPVPGPWATGCRPRSPHGWVHGVPGTGPASARRARGRAISFFSPARSAA